MPWVKGLCQTLTILDSWPEVCSLQNCEQYLWSVVFCDSSQDGMTLPPEAMVQSFILPPEEVTR